MQSQLTALKRYFSTRPDVAFAFLFGSQAKRRAGRISDWDIGVYFTPKQKGRIEWEDVGVNYPKENEIWDDLVDICKTEDVDLVVLNRAAAGVAWSAIRGIPLVIKDRGLFWDFALLIRRQAQDYQDFVDDYYAILQRASSLLPEDREKLKKIVSFLEEEMGLYDYFASFTIEGYRDIHKRHEVERWVENMVNSAIDIGEIVLASEKKKIPDYYRDVFVQLGSLPQFKPMEVERFTGWVKLRNILAHEYLDVRWQRLNGFIKDSEVHFRGFVESVKKFL